MICTIALAIMFWIAPVLAAISAVGVTVMGVISVWAVIRDRWFTQQLQLKSATLNDFFMETIQGILTVKTAGLEGQRQGQFANFSRDLFSCLQRQKVYQQVKEGLYQLTGSLEMVVFMLVVLPMVHSKLISLGDFFAYSFLRQIFTSYVTRIFYAIIQKSQLNVIDTRAHALFAPRDEAKPASFAMQLPTDTAPDLTFASLCYGYDPARPVLSSVSLSLRAGDQIAIVGESGAGKSTLLRLIAGLFSPQAGAVMPQTRHSFRNNWHSLSACKVRRIFCLTPRFAKTLRCSTRTTANATVGGLRHCWNPSRWVRWYADYRAVSTP